MQKIKDVLKSLSVVASGRRAWCYVIWQWIHLSLMTYSWSYNNNNYSTGIYCFHLSWVYVNFLYHRDFTRYVTVYVIIMKCEMQKYLLYLCMYVNIFSKFTVNVGKIEVCRILIHSFILEIIRHIFLGWSSIEKDLERVL